MIISLLRPSFTLHFQVLHSYGGVVGTEAVHESLGKHARHGKGRSGGVVALLYMTAFIIPKGDSPASARGGTPLPPYITIKVGKCTIVLRNIPCIAAWHSFLAVCSSFASSLLLINLCDLTCPQKPARVSLL